MNTWEKAGVAIAIVLILGFIALKSVGTTPGSSAFTPNASVLHVSLDSASPLSDLVIGGTHNRLESIWKFTLGGDLEDPLGAALAGINYTVHADDADMIETAYVVRLPEQGGTADDSLLGVATPVKSGERWILPFLFGEKAVPLEKDQTFRLRLLLDIAEVDGVLVQNDDRYDIAIDRPEDVLLLRVSPIVVKLNRNNLPVYNWVFKTRPYFSLSPLSPKGSLAVGTSVSVAAFDVEAHSAEDVTFMRFSYPHTGNSIEAKADYFVNDLSEEQVFLSLFDQTRGVLVAEKTANYSRDTIHPEFQMGVPMDRASELTIPAGETRTLMIRMDTTQFEDTGDWVQWYMEGNNSNEIQWSIEGDRGDYRHGDIILRGGIYAHTLVKS